MQPKKTQAAFSSMLHRLEKGNGSLRITLSPANPSNVTALYNHHPELQPSFHCSNKADLTHSHHRRRSDRPQRHRNHSLRVAQDRPWFVEKQFKNSSSSRHLQPRAHSLRWGTAGRRSAPLRRTALKMKEKESQTPVKVILGMHLHLVVKVTWKRWLISLKARTANQSPRETREAWGEVNQARESRDGCAHLPKRKQCSSRTPTAPTQSSFLVWFSERKTNQLQPFILRLQPSQPWWFYDWSVTYCFSFTYCATIVYVKKTCLKKRVKQSQCLAEKTETSLQAPIHDLCWGCQGHEHHRTPTPALRTCVRSRQG